MKKGFVLTMDVLVALVVAAVLISSIMYFATKPRIEPSKRLYLVGSDILAVSDKQEILDLAIDGDSTEIESFFTDIQANLCLDLNVTNSTYETVYDLTNGCSKSNYFIIQKRSITKNESVYLARLKIWQR